MHNSNLLSYIHSSLRITKPEITTQGHFVGALCMQIIANYKHNTEEFQMSAKEKERIAIVIVIALAGLQVRWEKGRERGSQQKRPT